MDKDEILAELIISDYDCNPNDISERLGLRPTKIATKGEVERNDPRGIEPPLLYDTNYWVARLDTKTADIYECLRMAIKILEPHSQVLNVLSNSYNVELSIFGTAYHPHVGVQIESRLIDQLKAIGVNLDISIYVLTPTYLDKKKGVDRLAKKLAKTFNKDHAEAQAIATTLATIEDSVEKIIDALSDICDTEADGQDIESGLHKLSTQIIKLKNDSANSNF